MAGLEDLKVQFQKVQGEYVATIKRQSALDAQLKECSMVKDELDALKEDEPVYKMHGKVLILQDTGEAKSTISARLKLIQGELTKVERSIATLDPQQKEIRQRLQEAMAAAGPQPPA